MVEKGDRTGWLAISKWIPFRRRNPPSPPASLPLRSLPLRSFLRAGLNWGGSTPFFLAVARDEERGKETERKRERGGGEDARNERNAAELDGKVVASHISPD